MADPSDTRPEIAARVRQILMAKSAAQRLAMGAAMSMGARALVAAGIRAGRGPDATEVAVRRGVFLRFYGGELGPERAGAIFDAIERKGAARVG